MNIFTKSVILLCYTGIFYAYAGENKCPEVFSRGGRTPSRALNNGADSKAESNGIAYVMNKLKVRLGKLQKEDMLLSRERETELVIKYQREQDQEALQELLLSLILYAQQRANTVASLWKLPAFAEDMLQETLIHLIKAIKSYEPDPSKPRLIAYGFAHWNPTFHRLMMVNALQIKPPFRRKHEERYEFPHFVSKDEPVYSEGEGVETWENRIPDQSAESMEDRVQNKQWQAFVRRELDSVRAFLGEEEKRLLDLWLSDYTNEDRDNLRVELSMSREKLKNMELTLMRKLKRYLNLPALMRARGDY